MSRARPAPRPAHAGRPDTCPERLARDLLGLVALPSICHGRSEPEVLEILVDTVRAAVGADLAYGRLRADGVDALRPQVDAAALEDARALADRLILERPTAPVVVDRPGRPDLLTIVVVPLGFYAEAGHLLVGSSRAEFPGPGPMALLQAAASLGSACLENARLLDAVREADRRKEQFLALLGHELRNPLAPIVTALDLMRMRHPACHRERAIIERHTRHMIELVDDLLDISRVTRGKMELHRERIELALVVERAVEMSAPLIERHAHELTVELPPALVDADPFRLAQVFANLLTNAARYTDPGGRISVRGVRVAHQVQVAVTDTGRGIAEDKLADIFEPFFQADRRSDALVGGLGLGLSLVRNLVALHDGTVTAQSDGPGLGSTFTVSLPLARAASAPMEAKEELRSG